MSERGNPPGKTSMNILEQIIADKRLEIEEQKKLQSLEELRAEMSGIGNRPDFVEALHATPMGLIAEVKRRSPSAGLIRDPFDPEGIAKEYESNGACAVSCLMDNTYFGGGAEDFSSVRNAIGLPMLYKEFVIDPWQIAHAKVMGASAVPLSVSESATDSESPYAPSCSPTVRPSAGKPSPAFNARMASRARVKVAKGAVAVPAFVSRPSSAT